MVSDISGKSPVVTTVLEQVGQWHCCVREAMNEDGFEQTLCIVNCVASSGDAKKTVNDVLKFFSPKLSAVKVQLTARLC